MPNDDLKAWIQAEPIANNGDDLTDIEAVAVESFSAIWSI